MSIHFVFPSDLIRPRAVDRIFEDQWTALRQRGFSTSLVSDGELQDRVPLRNVPADSTVVYRGWMLDPKDYERLVSAAAAAAASTLTALPAYLATHYLPNWYPLAKAYTPETHVLSLDCDLEHELRRLGWPAFFVKDYVKSLKTGRGSVIHDPREIRELIAEMRRVRGEIEGGLCVRRVEALRTETERRYFVIHGSAFAPDESPIPEPVRKLAECVPSPFFSIDTAENIDGALRVVEIGDGQVSDLVGWTADRFADIWVHSTSTARG